jgi:hypothetical protein
VTHSVVLRLLRNGCNTAELAEWFRMPETLMRGHVRAVERKCRRLLHRNVRLAA